MEGEGTQFPFPSKAARQSPAGKVACFPTGSSNLWIKIIAFSTRPRRQTPAVRGQRYRPVSDWRDMSNDGLRRYWLTEHHSIAGLACAATAVLIGHVAGATKTIRVGSGG
jgi:hypothetical protein